MTQRNHHDATDHLQQIADVAGPAAAAKDRTLAPDPVGAALREAIALAHDAGVSWGAIGDVLGMRRGAAYQRYRRRPSSR
jgi:hypothetical protein